MDKSTADRLEQLFDQVRTLPRERQELAAEALSEIAAADSYELSEAERAILEPALARAKQGNFASDEDVEAAIGKSWA
jgi:predicted transcriptional regulator